MPARRHIAVSQGQCATCGAHRLLKYAHRTMCCGAMRVLRRLRRSGGRGMPMAVRTMRLRCVLLQDRGGAWHALLRSQSAHRNEAARQAGCCQQGPMLPHARIVQRGPAYTGFSDMRLFELEAICENCLARSRRRLRSRSSNENRKRRMLRRRLLSMRRIDRPPQAKKIWGLRRIVCTWSTVGASRPQAVHGRLSRCKRLPLILNRASTPAWLATLRPVRPPGSELRLLPNQS